MSATTTMVITTTMATTTVPGTIPNADFKAGFSSDLNFLILEIVYKPVAKLHTCLGIDRISLLRFVHNNLWFIETVNSCAMCLEPKRAMACARCWKGRFAEPNDAYALFCSLPNTDCSRMRETRFIGMLKVSQETLLVKTHLFMASACNSRAFSIMKACRQWFDNVFQLTNP